MKKEKTDILSKIGKDAGFSVPDGYFDTFAEKLAKELPEPVLTPITPVTKWQRVRPFVYMAAMFGGVWCMMYLFSDLKSRSSMEYNEQIAEAMSDEKFVDDYMNYGNIDNYDILEQMYEDGIELGSIDSTIN